MEKEEITIEKILGSNAKEKTQQKMMQEILFDNETKSLFDDVCEEIYQSDITDVELVEMIKLLPHDLKSLLTMSVKNRQIGQLFRQTEYEEFIVDVKEFDDKGNNEFEKRYSNIREVDFKKFLKKRILTREEIEFLINEVVKKSGLEQLSYKERHETYSGENVYLLTLIKAHKKLTESKHTQARSKIKAKVNAILLKKVLEDIKKFNNTTVIEK